MSAVIIIMLVISLAVLVFNVFPAVKLVALLVLAISLSLALLAGIFHLIITFIEEVVDAKKDEKK